jgi:hypothetical protein
MLLYMMALGVILGVVGIYLGLYAFRGFTNIVHSVKPVSISYIVKLSSLWGISSCFSFFALISVFGTLTEENPNLSLQSLFALVGVSVVLGLFVFLGSLYQTYTTVKFRDLLLRKNIIKKD